MSDRTVPKPPDGCAIFVLVGAVLAAFVVLVVLWLFGWPVYKVWQQRKAGEARLAEAESSRQIAVAEARAKAEAATLLAEAEVERAKGVAAANGIIGESLKGHEEYLRYLWIHNLESGNNAVVYVPTEAGLPILEANRPYPVIGQSPLPIAPQAPPPLQ